MADGFARRGTVDYFPRVLDVEIAGSLLAWSNVEGCTALAEIDFLPVGLDGKVHAVKTRDDRQHGAVELDNAFTWGEVNAALRRIRGELRT